MTIQLQAIAASLAGADVTLDCFNRCNTGPLINLLPYGAMWPRDDDTTLYRVCSASAIEFGRVDCQVGLMLQESFPDTAQQTLALWEERYGIPDACDPGKAATIELRRDELLWKIRRDHTLNDEFWELLADKYGYPAPTITKNVGFCVGIDCAGDPICPIDAVLTVVMVFTSGDSDGLLECKVRKYWPPYSPLTVVFT